MKERISFKITKQNVIIMVMLVLLNFFGNWLSGTLNLPWWLDTAGTMAASILMGPIAGMIVAIPSTLIPTLIHGQTIAYTLIGVSVALVVGFLFPKRHKEDLFGIVSVAILSAVISSAISVPLNSLYFDGYTGNIWGDALYDMLSDFISSDTFNIFLSQFFIDMPDRVICILLALVIADMTDIRIVKKKKKKGAMSAAAMLICTALALSQLGIAAHAEEYGADYEAAPFTSRDGLPSAEVNAIAQTKDGSIWVGTYSGLFFYDGIKFERTNLNDKIKNVTVLFVDSKGRLWVGTNDSGIVCYDPESGNAQLYDYDKGMPSDSIRSIKEDNDGNIFVGTVLSLAKIKPDGTIKSYPQWEKISYAQSLELMPDGSIAGVTNSGILFTVKNDLLSFTGNYTKGNNIIYRNVVLTDEYLLVGTSSNFIDRYKQNGESLEYVDQLSLSNGSAFNKMVYDKKQNGVFYCCEKGLGFLDLKTKRSQDMSRNSFSDAISDICIDKQNNIWVSSSKQGLLKYARTPFYNVLASTSASGKVVNTVIINNNTLYVGTDNGLDLIDLRTGKELRNGYQGLLEKERIRNIYVDSKNNTWISTYGNHGLIRVDNLGQVKNLIELNPSLKGYKFRSVKELKDGRIVAASNAGLTFIKDDKAVSSIGRTNGLNSQFILTMEEKEDGTILAGSDGDGIYIIKNDTVIGHIGKNEGLDTLVVMRIVKCSGGYLYVTSNALYYDNGEKIKKLNNFPYFNNYDIFITQDKECWITSSAGLYIVSEEKLLKDEKYSCTLLNDSWGLNTTFTANSWNTSKDDMLYLCCTDGVRRISTKNYDSVNSEFQMSLRSIDAGGELIRENDGKWIIPATSERIQFNIAVNNYSLSNPRIHYYLEGSKDQGITCYQNEITPLSYTYLPFGEYKLHIQVLDELTGNVQRQEIIEIEKKAMMYERLYFRMYLLLVCVFFIMYIIWLFYTINKRTLRMRGLQMEISTDPMTGILNKEGSKKALEMACSEETGTLMMIDLDSFKLVNDLYGHDMGDKILIRFSQLLTQSLGEDNIAGRIGGDEFIGFIKDSTDEDRVEEITKTLNREITKSAKEYMGDDMTIPLGTSIGAIRVPEEGQDYHELAKLADKALYIVKQNGKHGYSFYQSKNKKEENQKDTRDLGQIKVIIAERNEGKGAYLVNFDKLQVIYKFLCRNVHVNNTYVGFLRFTPQSENGKAVPDEIMDSFENYLIINLKRNDVVSRYAGSFFVLCTYAVSDDYQGIAKRLIKGWKGTKESSGYTLTYEVESVD